jgi:hypothetical protein
MSERHQMDDTVSMDNTVAAMMEDVQRARTEALQARRLAVLISEPEAVRSLTALANDLEAKADHLSRRAAELLALERSLSCH